MNQFIVWVCLALVPPARNAIVELESGAVLGQFNGEYHSFYDIPYAEPPIGIRRFEAPVPLTTRWEGVRSAIIPSVSCVPFVRNDSSFAKIDASEDCLVLNVFTPEIDPVKPLPVRVHLYGGGFMIGTASETAEEFVVRQRNVLVMPNYRVGAFGFLSSGDDLISGNYGLKDQQMALRWVRDNIHVFGGDAGNVLVSGVSAGGASVHLHLLNPVSCGYIEAAMSSSGSALNPWVFQPNPSEQFAKYIRSIGCVFPEREAVKRCLQERTKEEHLSATNALRHGFMDNPFNVFGVVVEPDSVRDAFLNRDPLSLITSGQVCGVPWVVAHSEREGSFTASEFLQIDRNGSVLIEVLNQRWRELAPIALFYNNSCVNCTEEEAMRVRNARSDELLIAYMRGLPFSLETYPLLERMFTDVLFVDGIRAAIALHGHFSRGPVYAYEYRKPLSRGIGNLLSMCDGCSFGADHGGDLSYVLPLKMFAQPDAASPNSRFVSQNLIQMGTDLSTKGIARYAGIHLPINNATHTGKLIIYESAFEIETLAVDGLYTKRRFKNPTLL